ncbi:hypothetical protein GOP47_0006008 [Adiantum capillus-veneris]|uniref:DUF1771 domain-containing protein n=1 Tax=Adiantum capillus-veneris TaxID=13818 RepID=A0A9D4ZLM3_ADICA|nr:hypothetical protein GOP47_0006008 [Adiantum capillus-veneris]
MAALQETKLCKLTISTPFLANLTDGCYFNGNIQKSFEALQQLNSSSSSNDRAHTEVSTLGTLNQTKSSLLEDFKEVAAVGSMVETGEISSMTNVENCSTMNSHTLETYYAFEKAILKHENSSMKWVVERLCDKYPHAEVATLLEVLRATNFNLNDAEKMLQEACLHEGSPGAEERKDPCQLAKTILESLFSGLKEVVVDCEEKCKKNITRQMKETAAKAVEVPKWKAVTSAELSMLEDEERIEERKLSDVDQLNKLVKGSALATSSKEEGRSSYGDWDDYERHQASAKQHWKTMQSYLTAATAAYASSDFHKAELLTEKGNIYKQLSMEAKERANTFLLGIKSRQSESDFTLDLQEQHIPEALQLLRLHLKSFSSIPSCDTFTVVTGCLENPKAGHKRIKQEVVGYLETKGYKWVETTPFCLQIQMRETRHMEGTRTGCDGLSK